MTERTRKREKQIISKGLGSGRLYASHGCWIRLGSGGISYKIMTTHLILAGFQFCPQNSDAQCFLTPFYGNQQIGLHRQSFTFYIRQWALAAHDPVASFSFIGPFLACPDHCRLEPSNKSCSFEVVKRLMLVSIEIVRTQSIAVLVAKLGIYSI